MRGRLIASFALAILGCCGCGSKETTPNTTPNPTGGSFAVTSSAFSAGGKIPTANGCDASMNEKKPSLPLAWSGAPAATKSYVVLIDDLHPEAAGWVHWIVTDVPASTTSLAQGASGASMPAGAKEQTNTFGKVGYGGPCPPPKSTHEYRVRVFARPAETSPITVTAGSTGESIATSLADSLAVAELRGSYEPPY